MIKSIKPTTFDFEKKLFEEGWEMIVGIDEVGRGPLAGPVVACAATLKDYSLEIKNYEKKKFDLIRDSKMLSEKQREKLFDFIKEYFYVGIGMCDHETIDRMNILEASFLAMKAALSSLNTNIKNQNAKIIILVDGNKKIPNLSKEQRAIVNGDKIVKSISAASIVAKVTRDRIMREMDEKYPNYGFHKNKGYGTRFHMDALRKCGPCEIHRKTFEPVSTLAKSQK